MPLFGPSVLRYEIEIDKPIYFPGDELRGTLYIQCANEYKCRGVRVHLQGKGHCRFIPQTDSCLVEMRTQYYTNCKRTFFGNVNKTPVLKDCGPNAIFGPPWAPDEGVMVITVPVDLNEVIFRVMDDEWMVKDLVVGETLINIEEEVGKGIFVRPLFFDGKVNAGMLQYRIDWSNEANSDPSTKLLRVQIYKAYNLRRARWTDAKNDIYVQVYVRLPNAPVVPGQALPEPDMYITLPANTLLTVPFHFQLPYELPSSYYFNDQNYISYSIYSNVDVSWRKDPSTRRFFTVMAYRPKNIPPAIPQHMVRNVFAKLPVPLLCCVSFDVECLGSFGHFTMIVSTDQPYYVPGDIVTLHFQSKSTWSDALSSIQRVTIQLRRRTYLLSDEGYDQRFDEIGTMYDFPQYMEQIAIPLPSIAPTYSGGLGKNVGWFQQEVMKYGGRWANPPPDPIKWEYYLSVSIFIASPGIDLMPDPFVYREIPILVCGIQANPFPEEKVNMNLRNPFATAMNNMMSSMMSNMMNNGNGNMMMQQGGGNNSMAVGLQNNLQLVSQFAGMMQQQQQQMQQHQMQQQQQQMNGAGVGIFVIQPNSYNNNAPQPPMQMMNMFPPQAGMNNMNNMNMNMNMQQFAPQQQQQYQQYQQQQQPQQQSQQQQMMMYSQPPSAMNPAPMMYNNNNNNQTNYTNQTNQTMNYQNMQNMNMNHPMPNTPLSPITNIMQSSNRVAPMNDPMMNDYAHPQHSETAAHAATEQKSNFNPYGFTHAEDALAVHEEAEAQLEDKQVKPSFAEYVLTPSYGNALIIRDPEEDYTVHDSNLLRYQPVFYTKPPKHTN